MTAPVSRNDTNAAAMRSAWLCCLLPAWLPAQSFAAATLQRELAAILPRAGEQRWRELPWRTELRSALVAGQRQQKPVLLWAMNGHPLGQT